jgi:putative membrane protein
MFFMVKQLFQNRGLFIIITVCVVTLWLYFSDKLVLFVHPRYFLFTAIAAGTGLILSVAALVLNGRAPAENDDSSRIKIFSYLGLTGLVVAVLTLFTPTSLSTENINLARVNNFTFGTNETIDVNANDLTVKNWSTILSSNLSFDQTKEVSLTGFAIPIDDDNFFLARYVLSCCAIDAQPVAIPVHSPDWKDEVEEGDWVAVEGLFTSSTVDAYSSSLVPNELKIIEEPKDPYDY